MTDKRIRIILDSKEANTRAKTLDRNVRDVGKSADQTQFKFSRLALAIKGALLGGALAKGVSTLITAQREFDKLNAALITATGSAQNAGQAFADIERLAANTPFSVEKVTQAFIQLRNLGLDPSEEAIISYGNTASAMGKDLSQFIEAVADATTAEFERLKEFGIKARNEGDQIAFTFQGATKRIENNAKSIEQYLQGIGNENFAGAINERLMTLDGAVSNLGDAWSSLVRAVSASGASDVFEQVVRNITDGVNELTAAIRSGQLPAVFNAWVMSFEGFAQDFTSLLNGINSVYNKFTNYFGTSSEEISGFIGSAFTDAGPNIRAFIQLMTVEVAGAIDRVVAYAEYLKTAVSDFGFEDASRGLAEDLARINSVRDDSISLILKENEIATQSTKNQIEAAKQLRIEYEKNNQSKNGGLGQFAITPESSGDQSKKGGKGDDAISRAKSATAALQRELDARREISAIYRSGELDAMASQFEQERAQQSVQEQVRIGETEAKYAEDLAKREERFLASLESDTIENEQKRALKAEFENQNLISSQLLQQELTEIEQRGAKDREQIAKMEMMAKIDTWSSMASSGLAILQSFGSKSFQSQKNFAIADSIVNIAGGVAKALNNPYPANLGFAAQVGLQGAGLISTIKSAKPSSGGGSVPSISASPASSATASAVQTQQQTQPTKVQFTIENDIFGVGVKINDALKELQRNGVQIAGSNSR